MAVWFVLAILCYAIIPITKVGLRFSLLVALPLYFAQIGTMFCLAARQSSKEGIGFGSVFIVMG